LIVRTADYAANTKLPEDALQPNEIQITHPLSRQRFVPVVTIGLDRLSRCAEMTYTAIPRTLILSCAFDDP
ncbi:MAG TPA: hypothetical protein VNT42_01495, partial [Sphingomonas sp.]|nr:hypothetical protein [Sphingomonas sp.]